MATLLSAVSANGAGSGASHSGPCTVIIPNDSVFDGATVQIQIAAAEHQTLPISMAASVVLKTGREFACQEIPTRQRT